MIQNYKTKRIKEFEDKFGRSFELGQYLVSRNTTGKEITLNEFEAWLEETIDQSYQEGEKRFINDYKAKGMELRIKHEK